MSQGVSGSNCSAAFVVSFPDSTSFSNSASIRGRSPYEKRSGAREKIGGVLGVSDCGLSRKLKRRPGKLRPRYRGDDARAAALRTRFGSALAWPVRLTALNQPVQREVRADSKIEC
jgi:hypothetical protein